MQKVLADKKLTDTNQWLN